MTDKQVIIDGVDVSGCELIREIELDSEYICACNFPDKTSSYCKENPNCLYKKFKRKEQECERLKYNNDYEVAVLETTIDNLKEELEQETTLKEMYFTYYKAKHSDIKGEFFKLKEENEELKQKLHQCWTVENSFVEQLNQLEAELKDMTIRKIDYLEKSLIYEQALAEIKELAETCSFTDSNELLLSRIKQILQLISEVEDEN